jgi:hypothetical protein
MLKNIDSFSFLFFFISNRHFFFFFFYIGNQTNILKKRKGPLSIQEVYKENQTRASKKKQKRKPTKPTNSQKTKTQSPNLKPAKGTT